jgi:hypothetical protein
MRFLVLLARSMSTPASDYVMDVLFKKSWATRAFRLLKVAGKCRVSAARKERLSAAHCSMFANDDAGRYSGPWTMSGAKSLWRRELVAAGYTYSGGSHMNLRARTGGRSAVNPKPVQTLLIRH